MLSKFEADRLRETLASFNVRIGGDESDDSREELRTPPPMSRSSAR
jgi:hypothetical protein